ncbi:MAG: LPS-assembly protein LptD [Epsilonproteobacteria bacterium]|nr:LPS-assembly protein LptD [Campylobacterota bacterium]
MAKYSIASTCDIAQPDWKIEATSLKYNKQTKWLDLYNPTLYIKDIPILYLPYLGFSLNKTRSSGFLKPLIGYSVNEGFLFTLPYYEVISPAADLEIDPTIRTKRGEGVYSTFRFVHSPTSYGELKIGSFKDYDTYQSRYNLAHQVHHGWSFLYTNYDIFVDDDKLYMDLKNANDTDYFYLDSYNYKFKTVDDKILTSKINYITHNDKYYFGIYNTYFKDTSKESNADTMQILPQLNYHIFNNNFLNNFFYSLDANVYNYTRKQGYKALRKTILLPVNYSYSFFDDYLKFSATEQFSFDEVTTNDANTSRLTRLDTFVKIYTNLSKQYKTFNHHISLSATFGMDNYYNYNGVENEYLNTSLVKKSISFKLSQYLIAKDWKINHRLSEVYYIDDSNVENKYSDLLNDVDIQYKDYYLIDNNQYSIADKNVKYNSITVGYNDGIKKLELNYSFKRSISETYTLKGYWKFDGVHKLFGEYSYDVLLNSPKYQIFGISLKKRCWNYNISYKKEILPLLTSDGLASITQRSIYFEIELVPIGGIQQQYQFKSRVKE